MGSNAVRGNSYFNDLDITTTLIVLLFPNSLLWNKRRNYFNSITELVTDGLSSPKSSLAGTNLTYFRTDNQIKNHFHSKLRKAVRKLNKEVKRNFKKTAKIYPLSLIYKIV